MVEEEEVVVEEEVHLLLQVGVPLDPIAGAGDEPDLVAPPLLAAVGHVALHLVALGPLEPGVQRVRVGHSGRERQERAPGEEDVVRRSRRRSRERRSRGGGAPDEGDDVLPGLAARLRADVVHLVEDDVPEEGEEVGKEKGEGDEEEGEEEQME